MSKLDFVVPVYKPSLPILEKCVRSLIDQSLVEWSAVFVMDGPCDEAAALIRRLFKKSKNHYKIVDIEHGGACKARNEGFKHTTAPCVIFYDCDVIIEPHAAQAWVDIFDKQPDVSFCYSGYKFLDEKGAIQSEPFDPFLLRVTNYISTCFPVRREMVTQWDEQLESLQDWSFWLGVVSRGGKGKFLPGYAFSTAYPTPESISGKGCAPENWLARMDKVRELHNIPKREVCVTSLSNKMDGIALAKMIDADYLDRPNDKPSHFKTIIQIGFSLNPGIAELHASAWGVEHAKVLFWTSENVDEVFNSVSINALGQYSERFNKAYTMFVEDMAAKRIMEKAGFRVQILSLPMVGGEIDPLPEKPLFVIDASDKYSHVFSVLKRALPDVGLEISSGLKPLKEITGILHFYPDRLLSSSIKRMILSGRRVISNCQSPFTGFLDDAVTDERFIVSVVERVRAEVKKGPNVAAAEYYRKVLAADRLLETVR